jgi:hypothetical protein
MICEICNENKGMCECDKIVAGCRVRVKDEFINTSIHNRGLTRRIQLGEYENLFTVEKITSTSDEGLGRGVVLTRPYPNYKYAIKIFERVNI